MKAVLPCYIIIEIEQHNSFEIKQTIGSVIKCILYCGGISGRITRIDPRAEHFRKCHLCSI
jgi:hypothetical protein